MPKYPQKILRSQLTDAEGERGSVGFSGLSDALAPLYCSGEAGVPVRLRCRSTEEYRIAPGRRVQKLNAAKQKSKNLKVQIILIFPFFWFSFSF